MCRAIPPLPQYVFMEWCLVKNRDTLPLPFEPRVHENMERCLFKSSWRCAWLITVLSLLL
jgi:hypothetical protein